MEDFKKIVFKLKKRYDNLSNLYDVPELFISFDKLDNDKKTNQELLYFKTSEIEEFPELFIFGFNFFIYELREHDFKRYLGQNDLNFKIYKAYYELNKNSPRIKISDIINFIIKTSKDSDKKNKILERIMALAYYFEWDLEKDIKDIEADYYVKIPNNFMIRLKQRFNLAVISIIFENKDFFIFLNAKGKMICVLKDKNEFNKEDIEKTLFPVLKKIFKIKKITIF